MSGGMVLGIVGAVLGDISGKLAARERARGMLQQAQDAETQAILEELNAKTTEGDLRDQLNRTLASNNAAFAASGVALGSPVAAATTEADIGSAFQDISAERVSSLLKVGQMRRNAAILRKGAKMAAITGSLSAASGALSSIGGSMGGGGGGGGGGG